MRTSFLCLVVVVSGLAGCPEQVAVVGDGPGCLLDSDCDPGDLCVDGICSANPDLDRCTNNGDCDIGLVCRDNGCEQPPAAGDCQSDADCDRADRCTAAVAGGDDGAGAGDCLPSDACAHAQPDASGQASACDDGCFGNCVDRSACDGEDDCAPTEQCDPTDFVCLPIGDCDSDAECPLTAVQRPPT